ncbi:hypothetical protein ABFT80_07190 [Mesorhizobium sp. SB112]|uniref:hypothetical protein n=1 Tax=Mesorhizobium sp. SB112 TaxID=3151853 RepID=UPI003263587C
MTSEPHAIEVNANAEQLGRIQRGVISALQTHSKRTTPQLAQAIYGRVDVFELNSILRAIRQLTERGFAFTKTRKGRVNATGYVYEWSLMQ